MKIPSAHTDESLELKMTPMIDVVFLLLVFFVWTSSFELPEFDLPGAIAAPAAGGSEATVEPPTPSEAFDEILVRIMNVNAATAIELNGKRLTDHGDLKQRLTAIIGLGVQPPVVVHPDPDVTMRVATSVYDVARAAGADRVLFAAQEDC